MSEAKEITNKLWAMANRLRGTMDASEYKNYILPFMFYRYLSENQDLYLKNNSLEEFYEVTDPEEKEDYLEDISKGIGYAIAPEYTWDKIVDSIKTTKSKPVIFQIYLIHSIQIPNGILLQKKISPMFSLMSI